MKKKFFVRHFLCANLALFGSGMGKLEAVNLLTDEKLSDDFSKKTPQRTSKVLAPGLLALPEEILLLTISQAPVRDRLEIIKNLRKTCKYLKNFIDDYDFLVPIWKKKLPSQGMKTIKAELAPFLNFVKRSKALMLNVKVSKNIISGLRQLIEKDPFPVTYLAFKGEIHKSKLENIKQIFQFLTQTGSPEHLKIESALKPESLDKSPLLVFSEDFFRERLKNLQKLEVRMCTIPTTKPVAHTLNLPNSVRHLSLQTNVTFNVLQDSNPPAKRLKIETIPLENII